MKVVSQDYINGINGASKKASEIIYTINGTTTTLTSDNLFGVNVRQNTDLLRTIMKELEFISDRAIPLETIVKYKFGVYTDSDYEYVDYGDYIVFSCEKQEDSNNYKILAYDNMLKAKVEYKTLQHGTFPMTIRSYINNLCTDLGLTFKNASSIFANYDKTISDDLYANLGYTYFDIFDELSQVTASNIAIDSTNKVEIRYITNSGVTIGEDYLKNYNVSTKEKYGQVNTIVLTRAAGSDSIYYPTILPENPYELKIEDNQIMNFDNRDEFLPDIYNKLNGLQFYTNDYTTYGITFLDLCDMYNLEVNNTTYPCLMLNTELIASDGVEEKIYTPMPNTSSTKYETASATDRMVNRTSLIVDKQGQQITSVISQIGDRSQKTTTVTQDIDGLTSKVEMVVDITKEEESNSGQVSFEKVMASEPLELIVKPIGSNISYMYPRNNLYPSDTLYSPNRKIRFANTTTNENFDYELPDDLLYYDSTHFDEFKLNYTDKICQVVKKCKYNANGEVELLTTPTTLTFDYPYIAITDGDYNISILGYNQGYIKVTVVMQNGFTNQLATKVEMNSEISQTAQEINLEVSKKVGNDEVISKINQSAEQITIQANKIGLTSSDVINLIADNSIDLTSKNVTINSTNFNVDKNGNVTINSPHNSTKFKASGSGYAGYDNSTEIVADGMKIYSSLNNLLLDIQVGKLYSGGNYYEDPGIDLSNILGHETNISPNRISLSNGAYGTGIMMYTSIIQLQEGSSYTEVSAANGVVHSSREEYKKNIKKHTNNLKLIKDTDVYEYLFKEEDEENKPHIGLIIGEKYNTPEEIINEEKTGINLQDMCGVMWGAIKELKEEIEQLKKEMEELK